MFKVIIFSAILAVALAIPAPESKADPNPAAKPSLIAAAYTSPYVAAPAVAYTSAYTSPVAYSGYYASGVYPGGYAYPYSSPYVVV